MVTALWRDVVLRQEFLNPALLVAVDDGDRYPGKIHVDLRFIKGPAGQDGRTQLDSLWRPFNSDVTNSYDSGIAVSATTDFIAELVRAANEVEKLSPHEVSNMLDRSVNTIRELRRDLGIVPVPGKDALIYIRTVSAGAARVPQDEWHHGLLHAAEMIRDLHIVRDTGTEFRISEIEP